MWFLWNLFISGSLADYLTHSLILSCVISEDVYFWKPGWLFIWHKCNLSFVFKVGECSKVMLKRQQDLMAVILSKSGVEIGRLKKITVWWNHHNKQIKQKWYLWYSYVYVSDLVISESQPNTSNFCLLIIIFMIVVSGCISLLKKDNYAHKNAIRTVSFTFLRA